MVKQNQPKKPRKKAATKKAKKHSVAAEFASEGRYMTAQDVIDADDEMVLTIASSQREKMPNDGQTKRVTSWEEPDVKPTVLNQRRGNAIIEGISEFAEDWPGHRIRLSTEPTSMGPGIVFEVLVDDDSDVEEDDDSDADDEFEDV